MVFANVCFEDVAEEMVGDDEAENIRLLPATTCCCCCCCDLLESDDDCCDFRIPPVAINDCDPPILLEPIVIVIGDDLFEDV